MRPTWRRRQRSPTPSITMRPGGFSVNAKESLFQVRIWPKHFLKKIFIWSRFLETRSQSQEFRFWKWDEYIWVFIDHFWSKLKFAQVYHQPNINKFNQVKFAQIPDKKCKPKSYIVQHSSYTIFHTQIRFQPLYCNTYTVITVIYQYCNTYNVIL